MQKTTHPGKAYLDDLVKRSTMDNRSRAELGSALKVYLDAKVERVENGDSVLVQEKITKAILKYLSAYARLHSINNIQFSQEIAFEIWRDMDEKICKTPS
ncbi:hypothetical protein GAMM_130033 [Gammaproteobacteria bacterium]